MVRFYPLKNRQSGQLAWMTELCTYSSRPRPETPVDHADAVDDLLADDRLVVPDRVEDLADGQRGVRCWDTRRGASRFSSAGRVLCCPGSWSSRAPALVSNVEWDAMPWMDFRPGTPFCPRMAVHPCSRCSRIESRSSSVVLPEAWWHVSRPVREARPSGWRGTPLAFALRSQVATSTAAMAAVVTGPHRQ